VLAGAPPDANPDRFRLALHLGDRRRARGFRGFCGFGDGGLWGRHAQARGGQDSKEAAAADGSVDRVLERERTRLAPAAALDQIQAKHLRLLKGTGRRKSCPRLGAGVKRGGAD